MSEMTRPVLSFAVANGMLPPDAKLSDLTSAQRIIAGIAWMADNSEYGIDNAAKELIYEFHKFASTLPSAAPATDAERRAALYENAASQLADMVVDSLPSTVEEINPHRELINKLWDRAKSLPEEHRYMGGTAHLLLEAAEALSKPVSSIERVAQLERELAHAREEWKKYMNLSCEQAGELERLTRSATPASSWTPVTERMPESGKYVLAYLRNEAGMERRIRAFHATKHSMPADEETINNDAAEYVEAEDEFYLREGWYECNEYEEAYWFVTGPVTHWMPLPEGPRA